MQRRSVRGGALRAASIGLLAVLLSACAASGGTSGALVGTDSALSDITAGAANDLASTEHADGLPSEAAASAAPGSPETQPADANGLTPSLKASTADPSGTLQADGESVLGWSGDAGGPTGIGAVSSWDELSGKLISVGGLSCDTPTTAVAGERLGSIRTRGVVAAAACHLTGSQEMELAAAVYFEDQNDLEPVLNLMATSSSPAHVIKGAHWAVMINPAKDPDGAQVHSLQGVLGGVLVSSS